MKIILPGGSGQIGTLLARTFHSAGHEVVVLSRTPAPRPWRSEAWNPASQGSWVKLLDGADAVINLAGRSVNCRYTAANRREILRSRIETTQAIARALAAAMRPPGVWLQSSTATIYAHRHDAPNDEQTGILGGNEPDAPPGWRFSVEVATAWEQAVDSAPHPETRTVLMRSAIVLGLGAGGIFETLLRLVRLGLGGRAGSGRQYVSWIHEQDFVAAVSWLLQRDDLAGAVNIAAPHPLTNAEFMGVLRRSWGTPLGLPATRPMLELGAALMRTETELILKSRRVVPRRLLDSGFSFRYPEWPQAAAELIARQREGTAWPAKTAP